MTTKLAADGAVQAPVCEAWWFGADASASGRQPPDNGTAIRGWVQRPLIILAVLVAVADFLFWGHDAGLSLSVFAVTVFAAAAIGKPWHEVRGPMALVGIMILPVIEFVQPLSLLFLGLGLVVAIAWVRRPKARRLGDIAAHAGALVLAMPLQASRDLKKFLLRHRDATVSDRTRASAMLRNWGLPIGGTAILISLLLDANPILADWLAHAFDLDINWDETVGRILFWVGLAMALWPMVVVPAEVPALTRPNFATSMPRPLGFNAGSVLRALVLFNLVLGIQTSMDATILWGEGRLPDGMGYAEYAHRGAYPLLATALLAGAFALAARPFLSESRYLRPLVLLWLAQNVALCVSSAKRLGLYVDAFGLTYLRLYVMVWIAVVGIGLSLTAWQIWKSKPNRWLLLRSAGLAIGVLYLASFGNFAHLIATQNVNNTDRPIDWSYLESLPDIVNPTIRASDAFADLDDLRVRSRFNPPDPIDGWRDWGFRRWRIDAKMSTAE